MLHQSFESVHCCANNARQTAPFDTPAFRDEMNKVISEVLVKALYVRELGTTELQGLTLHIAILSTAA